MNPPMETNSVSDFLRRRPESETEVHALSHSDRHATGPEKTPKLPERSNTSSSSSILAKWLAGIGPVKQIWITVEDESEPVWQTIYKRIHALRLLGEPKPLECPSPAPAPKKSDNGDTSSPKFLEVLTEAQRRRLTELPEKRRQRVEMLLATGDRICQGEAFRLLAPPPEARPAPTSVEELLSRLREDPVYPSQAAEALAQAFDDRRSWGTYHAVCQRAWAGHVPCSALVQAWQEATNGRARNPGALFMSVLKREVPEWSSGPR